MWEGEVHGGAKEGNFGAGDENLRGVLLGKGRATHDHTLPGNSPLLGSIFFNSGEGTS